jgi:hypothetical protein
VQQLASSHSWDRYNLSYNSCPQTTAGDGGKLLGATAGLQPQLG